MLKIAFYVTSEKHIDYIKIIKTYCSSNIVVENFTDRNDFNNTKLYEFITEYKPDIVVLCMAYPKKSVLTIQRYCLEKNIPCRGIQEVHQMGLNKNRLNHYLTPIDGLVAASLDEKERLKKHHIYCENILAGGWPFISKKKNLLEKKHSSIRNKKAVLFLSPLRAIDSISLETEEVRKSLIEKVVNLLSSEWELILKPHPLEKISHLNLQKHNTKGVGISVAQSSISSSELIEQADVCFNYGNSQVCIESLVSSKPLFVLDESNDYLPVVPSKEIDSIDKFLYFYCQEYNQKKIELFIHKNIDASENAIKRITSFIQKKEFTRDVNKFALHLSLFYVVNGEKNISLKLAKDYISDDKLKKNLSSFILHPNFRKLVALKRRFKQDQQAIWLLSTVYNKSSNFFKTRTGLAPSYYLPFYWRQGNNNIVFNYLNFRMMHRLFKLLISKLTLKKPIFKKHLDPDYLVFPVTYRCNLRCSMCTCPQQAKKIGELSLEDIDKSLRNLTNRGNKKLRKINLTGGELFLRKDLDAITNLLVNYGASDISISSNCYSKKLTIDPFIELIKSYPKISWSFQTSLDGDENIHNTVRRSAKAFQNTIDVLQDLKLLSQKYGFKISVNATVTPENIDNIISVESIMRGLGVSLNYTYAVDSDLYINSKDSEVNGKLEKKEYVKKLQEFSSNVYNKTHDLFSLDFYLMLNGFKRFSSCSFYHGGYFIEPSGRMYKCSVTKKSFLFNAIDEKRPTDKRINETLRSISKICESCVNNCGNSLYSTGFVDFYKSDFFKSRAKIYLSTSSIDFISYFNFKRLGIAVERFKGQELNENELLLYTRLGRCISKNNLIKYVQVPIGAY